MTQAPHNISGSFMNFIRSILPVLALLGVAFLLGARYADRGLSSPATSGAWNFAEEPALAPDRVSMAEYLVEGDSTNGDDQVVIGGQTIGLSGSEHSDLVAIADAAAMHGDFSTQYGAIVLATAIAPDSAQPSAWNRYGALFGSLPVCGAVALAEALPQDIVQSESRIAGLSAHASVAYSSLSARAWSALQDAEKLYEGAQGWVDDDESMIERARVQALAANAMNRTNPDSQLTHRAEDALASTSGDLWEHGVDRADRVFSGDRAQWRSAVEWARGRAVTTLSLYESGRLPSRPQGMLSRIGL